MKPVGKSAIAEPLPARDDIALPPPGCWSLGKDREKQAEVLLRRARAQSLRTAWQSRDAGFVSNLSVAENLQLLHDWHALPGVLDDAIATARDVLGMAHTDWLTLRPAQLSDTSRREALLLRLCLLRPDVLVIDAPSRQRSFDATNTRLHTALAGSRLLLLGPAIDGWPLWPDHAILTGATSPDLS